MNTFTNGSNPILQELRNINLDYKASVVAGEIIDNGVPKEIIFFKNLSLFKRFVSKEINHLYWDRIENEPDQLVFELNKEGLYDMLPEGIIHAQGKKKKGEQNNDEFKELREQEKNARKFFSPIENEFAARILDFDLTERELFKNSNKVKNRQFFEYFFGKSDILNDQQLLTLLYVLPLSHKIRGNLNLISLTLSKILNFQVTVTKGFCKTKCELKTIPNGDNNFPILGVDAILSGFVYSWTWKYMIQIEDVMVDDFMTFGLKGKNRNIIDFVTPFFFPVNADIQIQANSKNEEKNLFISDTKICFLGFNSYI